jgi:RHS repeat-associated protein
MWVFSPRNVTVRQKDGTLVEDATVEAYTATAYTGQSAATDENGVAQITLPQGWYRFRVQVPSGQYWSGDQVHCKTPDCKGVTVVVDTYDTIPVSVLNTNGTPQGANHIVTAFTGETATEYSAASDSHGQAILTLLEGNYRFRALYQGATFWSAATNHCAIPGCSGATVEVSLTTQVKVRDVDGQPVAGVEVYAFDGDSYTNFNQVTNEDGTALFVLPFGHYRFRADVGGTSFWSGVENHYTLPTTWPYVNLTVNKPVTVSVVGSDGAPVANTVVDVYAGEDYTGRSATTSADGKVNFRLPDGEYRFRVEQDGHEYWSGTCQMPGCEVSGITSLAGLGLQSEVTIDYEYDSLYRLTAADYSTGDYYHYVYDAVGNRLSQESQVNDFPISLAYAYDAANRLMSVGDVAYTYDANGNLLEDGVNTYTYDPANRLSALNGASTTIDYTYNGLNDRLQETVNGSTTTFTMDLNTGLTQALSDGTHTYTYGLGRIAQYNNTTAEYFLGDALGSVRQLTDSRGVVTLAKSYDPYGTVSMTAGTSQSSFGYTAEFQGDYNDLVYLRARMYAPGMGRFLTRDTWAGDANQPITLNEWVYANSNLINYTDPTGYSACYNPLPASCQTGLAYVYGFASALKGLVTSGALEPIEAFATLADLSKSQFNGDTRDLIWAMTIVLNDFDANRGMIAGQILFTGGAKSSYYIHQDWLPYRNNPIHDNSTWGGGEYGKWIHSLRGDWSEKYWDKTANQAYHFWGLLAITYFDGGYTGDLANWDHDGEHLLGQQQENYDFSHSDPNVAPPPSGISKPDYDLSVQAIRLGDRLRLEAYFRDYVFHGCEAQWKFVGYTDIGQWIRANLKG